MYLRIVSVQGDLLEAARAKPFIQHTFCDQLLAVQRRGQRDSG